MTRFRVLKPQFYNFFLFHQKKICDLQNKSSLFLSCNYPKVKHSYIRHYSYENCSSYAAIINKKDSFSLTIDKIRTDGFVLSNNTELVGSTIIFPHSIISWHVSNASEVTEDSLTLFKILDPKVDILIFGFGNPKNYTKEVQTNFVQFCRKYKMKFEALPTHQAVGLFNFLSVDMRYVAAALIPPSTLSTFSIDKRNYGNSDDIEDFDDYLENKKYFEEEHKKN